MRVEYRARVYLWGRKDCPLIQPTSGSFLRNCPNIGIITLAFPGFYPLLELYITIA